MRIAIEFDDESFLNARKVGDVTADRMLATPLQRFKPPTSKFFPKQFLGE